jgi:hypothetical protein
MAARVARGSSGRSRRRGHRDDRRRRPFHADLALGGGPQDHPPPGGPNPWRSGRAGSPTTATRSSSSRLRSGRSSRRSSREGQLVTVDSRSPLPPSPRRRRLRAHAADRAWDGEVEAHLWLNPAAWRAGEQALSDVRVRRITQYDTLATCAGVGDAGGRRSSGDASAYDYERHQRSDQPSQQHPIEEVREPATVPVGDEVALCGASGFWC